MNLDGVAQILQEQALGRPGQSLFVDFLPADKDGILLRQPSTGSLIDHELPGYTKTSFMLIVRGNGREKCKKLILDAMQALTISGKTVAGMHINYMRPRTEPLAFPLSAGNKVEYSTNIDCCYVMM